MADFNRIIRSMTSPDLLEVNSLNTTEDQRIVVNWVLTGTTPSELVAEEFTGWTALTAAEQQALIEAMEHIETFLNVDFQQLSEVPDEETGVFLEIAKIDQPEDSAGIGGFEISKTGNDVDFFYGFAGFNNLIDLANLGFEADLILHELGHALGLGHPFEEPVVPKGTDNQKYSLMSYTVNPDNGMLGDPMLQYDILALQQIWGAADYNTDDTTYTGSRVQTVDAVWDTGGIDTFDAKGDKDGVVISLRQGGLSQFGDYPDVSIAFGTVIENANGGAASDLIRGNEAANMLSGGRGDDSIRGNGGGNTIKGGKGNDILFGGNGKDKIFGGGGDDLLIGGAGRDILIGGKRSDTFVFREGNDHDRIRDFRDDVDVIDLTGFGFDTANDALEFATQKDNSVILDFGDGDRLSVNNAVLTELADDLSV